MTERAARSGREPSPLVELTLARLRLFLREPSAVFWTFGFPILLTLALGVAFRSRPPEPVRVAVEAGAGADLARDALRRGEAVEVEVLAPEEARAALRAGRVALVVVPGGPPTYRFDPTRPESRLARAVADDLLQRGAGRRDAIVPRDERVVERGARYVDFLVPGLLGLNVMSSGMWGIGWVIVETRQKKLLKRLVATPMRHRHFLLSFVLFRMVFLAFELPVLLGFAMVAFDVPLRGSVAAFATVSVLGALAFAGLGLLVASRAQNVQTVGGLINLVMMPMWVLSGVFFSWENFPAAMRPAIRALPLTALNDALRAVMNEGAPLAALGPELAVLGVVSVAAFAAALRLFRWT